MATRTYRLIVACGTKRNPRYTRDLDFATLDDAQSAVREMLARARRHDPAGAAWNYWAVQLDLPAWGRWKTIAYGTATAVTFSYRNYGFNG